VNWNYASQLVALCVSLPFFLAALWIDWPSDGWFIAALIAAGTISLPVSRAITAQIQRNWKQK